MTTTAPATTAPADDEVVAARRHDRAMRWMHWLNFPLLTIMIWSGLRIYWAEAVYRIGWGDWTLFAFFPDWFDTALDLDFHLASGMAYHFFFGWLFFANGLAYVAWSAWSGEWRRLVPLRGSIGRSFQVLLHDLHLRDDAPPQRGLYNDAQRLTYTGVIVMGFLSIATGLAIYKPIQLNWLMQLFGGYQPSRAIHFVLTLLYVLFFVVHVAQVARAGWGSFFSMVMGYERTDGRRTPAPRSEREDA